MSERSRTSTRLSAYGGAISYLLAQADEVRVTPDDRRTLPTVLLSFLEALWSQATRTALYASRQRRVALTAMGFPLVIRNRLRDLSRRGVPICSWGRPFRSLTMSAPTGRRRMKPRLDSYTTC